jgi:phosphate-selective porin OprO/OprP
MIKNKKLLCVLISCLSSSSGAVEFDVSEDVSIELEGKLHYDAAVIDKGSNKKQDSQIRRARVSATAKFGKDVRVKLEYDIKDSTPTVEDAYIEYRGFDHTSIKVGNVEHIAGLENSSSSSQYPLMERSVIQALLPDSGVGVQVSSHGDNWTLSAAVTGDAIKSFDEFKDKISEKEVITTRATAVFLKKDDSLLHLGGTITRTDPHGKKVRFRSKGGSKLSDVVASTGKMDNIESYFSEGLEVAWNNGGLLLQGEYIRTQLNNKSDTQDNIEGWHVSAAYALSGATHKYNKKKGAFAAPKIKKKGNNVELVARVATLNLDSRTLSGGVVKSKTIGVNYSLNDKTRLMLNYDWTDVESGKNTKVNSTTALQARIQMSFY